MAGKEPSASLPHGIDLRRGGDIPTTDLVSLYASAGWRAYTRDPDGLARAVQGSTYVVSAWNGGELIGLARGLSDDVSVFFLQDILVRPEWQRQGIGRALLADCLERYSHVRLALLLTDDKEYQTAFYQSFGFANVGDLRAPALNALVRFAAQQSRQDEN